MLCHPRIWGVFQRHEHPFLIQVLCLRGHQRASKPAFLLHQSLAFLLYESRASKRCFFVYLS